MKYSYELVNMFLFSSFLRFYQVSSTQFRKSGIDASTRNEYTSRNNTIHISILTSDSNRFLANTTLTQSYQWKKDLVEASTTHGTNIISGNKFQGKHDFLNFEVALHDDECSQVEGPDLAVRLHYVGFDHDDILFPNVKNRTVHTDVFLGMTCDKVVDFISSIATKWEVPVVSVGSRGNELMLGRQSDPNSLKTVKRETFTRVGPTANALSSALESFMMHYKFDTVATIHPTGEWDWFHQQSAHASPVEEGRPFDCDYYVSAIKAKFDDTNIFPTFRNYGE